MWYWGILTGIVISALSFGCGLLLGRIYLQLLKSFDDKMEARKAKKIRQIRKNR